MTKAQRIGISAMLHDCIAANAELPGNPEIAAGLAATLAQLANQGLDTAADHRIRRRTRRGLDLQTGRVPRRILGGTVSHEDCRNAHEEALAFFTSSQAAGPHVARWVSSVQAQLLGLALFTEDTESVDWAWRELIRREW